MKFVTFLGAALFPFISSSFVSAIEFNPDDDASIRAAARQYAYGLMSYYKNNATGLPKEQIGFFPKPPYYWWEAGAAWGGMIEYTQFTGDPSHVRTLHQALVANYGPDNDIILPWKKDQEGNDDQAFWAFALMSALEYQFPDPEEPAPATYLQVVENCFNNIVARWDTTSCGGGLKWQIYPENAYGYNYKNAISNGATFALAARLARYTGNQTYADWAVKIWDWTKAVGLMSDQYEIFDGTDDKKNCSDRDHTQWSYNNAVYLHGAAVLYNYTKGDETWKKHVSGMLDHSAVWFTPYDNATDIMYEAACEKGENGRKCNIDQQSFKAYLSRFLAKTAVMAPFTKDKVSNWLRKSAVAAAKSCSGGESGTVCGSKWYTGVWDGTDGVGQQLSALEVTQALLMLRKNVTPGTHEDSEPLPSTTATPGVSSTSVTSTGAESTSTPLPFSASSSISSPALLPTLTPTSSLTSSLTISIISTASNSPPADLPTSNPGGVFIENPSSSSKNLSCTPSSTTTVYVPSSAPAVPTSSVPAASINTSISIPPSATTTAPEPFLGSATNTKSSGLSLLAAIAFVIISGIV